MEIGISIPDMDYLTIGLIIDIWNEKGRDSLDFPIQAGQAQFDSF